MTEGSGVKMGFTNFPSITSGIFGIDEGEVSVVSPQSGHRLLIEGRQRGGGDLLKKTSHMNNVYPTNANKTPIDHHFMVEGEK